MFTLTREEYAKRFEGIDFSDQITEGMTPEEVDEVYRSEAAAALTKDEYRQYVLNEKLINSVTEFINTDYNDVEDFQYNFKDWSYEDLLEANDYYARETDDATKLKDCWKERQQQETDKREKLFHGIMLKTLTCQALIYAVAGLACCKERINRTA